MDTEQKKVVAVASYIALSCAYSLKKKAKKEKRKRRWWMVSILQSREKYSATNMLSDLNKEPSGKFENFCRMSASDFEYLINKIGPLITKKDTNMRKAIPAQERLAITLRFLASGDSFVSLSYLFKVSNQIISSIVHEVCSALVQILKDEIKMPTSQQEWSTISTEWEEKWNYPHCIGAMDGKHIITQCPINSGSEYINYKGTFSVVLMALVDANYNFLYADIGCQGRISDGGVFRNTTLFKKIENNVLLLPADQPLPTKTLPMPYVIVADDAFALSTNIMKPYPGPYAKGSVERVFNYRLSRARRVVENVFGIMASTFRMLRKPILLEPEKVTSIVMACVLLHNFLRKSRTSSLRYTPLRTIDSENEGEFIPGTWRNEIDDRSSMIPLKNVARKSGLEAKKIRDEFADYFSTTDKLPWQDKYC